MSSLFDFVVAFWLLSMGWPILRARIRSAYERAEGVQLLGLLDRALLLRATAAVVINVSFALGIDLSLFWGDSGYYDVGAWLKAQAWAGEGNATFDLAFSQSGYGWLNVVAVGYYFFGRNQILIQLLNVLFGTLTVWIVYQLARDLFGAAVAGRAGRFMTYFPQMIIWASGMYKDPAILLSIAMAMLAVTRLRVRFTTGWLLLYLGAALWLISLRFYVFYFLVIATLGTFIFGQRRGFVASVFTNGVLLMAFFLTFSLVIGTTTAERQIEQMLDLKDLQRRRTDLVQSAGSGFGAEFDISTPGGAIAAVPVGAVHLLFAPFPWAISGLRQALTIPETLYWYSLMPAFLVGLRVAFRDRFGPAMPVLVFAATLIGAYSVMQGNVGTAYRQRTQVTMFFFILMAVGIEEKGKRRMAGRGPQGLAPEPNAPPLPSAPGPRAWAVPPRGAAPVAQPGQVPLRRPPPRRGA